MNNGATKVRDPGQTLKYISTNVGWQWITVITSTVFIKAVNTVTTSTLFTDFILFTLIRHVTINISRPSTAEYTTITNLISIPMQH